MKPIISYVIPCYNCEETIASTVNSIKETHEAYRESKGLPSQWDQIEVILVNDGSTDATPMILDALSVNHGNIVVVHQENKGKGASRNAGNQIARADVIGCLDADDWHLTDRTAYILKTFAAHPDASIFYSSFIAKHIHLDRMGEEVPFMVKKLDVSHLKNVGEFQICHSTVAYRREAILKHPYSEERNKDDWWMLWTFFTNDQKFCFCDKYLVCYFIKESSYIKETSEDNTTRILNKKKKIMEPYFEGAVK